MIDVPWWARSPSPFTFIFWIILALWGHIHLRGKLRFKRWQYVCSLVSSALVLGIIVFAYDSLWIVGQYLKFGYLYPKDVGELQLRLIQNVGFLMVCLFSSLKLFEKKILQVNRYSVTLCVLMASYFILWFLMASDPGCTDWTYAIRMGFESQRIIGSFILSHFIGKLLQGLLFISLFQLKLRGVN